MEQAKLYKAEMLYPSSDVLGENALWDADRNSLFWIDIEAKKLHELNVLTERHQSWHFKERLGMIVHDEDGNLLMGLQSALSTFNLQSFNYETYCYLSMLHPQCRPNDGNCDSLGRLWMGTMSVHATANEGNLYCFEKSSYRLAIKNLTVPNGKVWNHQHDLMYFTDSVDRCINKYSYNMNNGALTFMDIAVKIPDEMGLPDGFTIDTDGMLWIAHWDGFAVCRWNPNTGELLEKIELPVPRVTSCAFGGEEMSTLYITTAKTGLSSEDLDKYPLSGNLFSVKTSSTGLKRNTFKY